MFLLMGVVLQFSVYIILRYGDPISPFLSIIFMEGLHVTVEDVISPGLFCRTKVGDEGFILSKMLYVDDVIQEILLI